MSHAPGFLRFKQLPVGGDLRVQRDLDVHEILELGDLLLERLAQAADLVVAHVERVRVLLLLAPQLVLEILDATFVRSVLL